jgi:uncharacterized Zn-finger protein
MQGSHAMQPIETITVDSTSVGCDGGDGPLGHPKVYISLEKNHEGTCPYCGRHYVLRAGARIAAGH